MAIRAPNHRLQTGVVRWEHWSCYFQPRGRFSLELSFLWPYQG